MNEIVQLAEKIREPDENVRKKASERLDNLTKPKGSLGRLEDLAIQVAGITGKLDPSLNNRYSLVFAGDHGVAEEGVSAYPQEVTVQMLANFIHEGAAVNILGKLEKSEVIVIDVGVAAGDLPEKVVDKKVMYGTNNFVKGPAMSRDQAIRSIMIGYEIVEDLADSGLDLLGLGDMGIANTTPSSAITSVITGSDPQRVTGTGTGIDEESLAHKIKVVERGIEVNDPNRDDAIDVLSKLGGLEIGAIAGGYLAGAANHVPILVDGFITTSAALVAHAIEPLVAEYMVASHNSVEQGHMIALKHLGLSPLLDLNLRLGEGTGAVLAMNLVTASMRVLNEMYTFAEAGVSTEED